MTSKEISSTFEQRFANVRKRIDQGLERWGYWVFDHAWLVIIATLLVLGGLISQIPKMVVDTSAEGFLHEDAPFRVTYNEFRFQFGRDERALVIIDSGNPDGIFNTAFLNKLEALHKDLEKNTPKLQKVDSLINARMTIGENDQLLVEDFLEDWPDTPEKLQQLKKRAYANPLYPGLYFSNDARYAMIMVENDTYSSLAKEKKSPDDPLSGFDDTSIRYDAKNHPPFLSGQENTEIVLAIDKVLEKHEAEGFHLQQTGTPFMLDRLTRIMMGDMTKFILLSMLVISILLFVIFRRASMIFLPLIVSGLSMLGTLGVMTICNIPMTGAAQIIPSLLITIGVAGSVHVFVIFYQRSKAGDKKRDAVAHSLGHSGVAIMMTSFANIAGLSSFITSDIKPISDFGIIAPIGVFNALLATLILLPALIAILPIKEFTELQDHTEAWSQKLMAFCGDLAIRFPWRIICIWGALVIFAFSLALQMRFSHNTLNWFKKNDETRVSMELLDHVMEGSIFLELIFDTGKPNGVKDPDFLKRLEKIQDYAANQPHAGLVIHKASSIVDVVKEINQALHNNDPAYYTIPDDANLLAQEILLFENSGSEDLEKLTDESFSKARVTLKLNHMDALSYPPFMDEFVPAVNAIIEDKATYEATGIMALAGTTFKALMTSMAQSYGSSIFFITALMILFVGSWRIGLLSMIPNVSPIIITLGIMVILDFPLDAFTLFIGSIGLGLAVDDTMHFMNTYQRNFHECRDPGKAVRDTMATAGEAMFFTCAILSSAFFIYIFSSMVNLQIFGILTGCCILIAASADAFLNPALMYLYGKRQLRLEAENQNLSIASQAHLET
jgi:predicted RND superfamily exporter protein